MPGVSDATDVRGSGEPTGSDPGALHDAVLDWYDQHARDLPWRRPDASAWSVLVSELMLQQTPVARVLPVHQAWLERWPRPADLAAAPAGDAVRAWGRLGYPRRALRLHAAARAITERHHGEVPAGIDELRALPGVGEYTAAAVAVFAHGRRHPVLDTNVRRVHARLLDGRELPGPSLTRAETRRAADLLPGDAATAATWSVAVMELGALVCTAVSPRCEACPAVASCAWVSAGRPAYDGPPRRGQAWAGTDRQCRGRLLGLARERDGAVPHDALARAWPEAAQRERCLASLEEDGLLLRTTDGWTLPD
jgi:A/G-specific adenine glycosylase